MSYDIRFGVKVEGAADVYAIIGRPKYDSPSYNIREIFVRCMNWDYEQGRWYRIDEVLAKIEDGIKELISNPHLYRPYEPENGCGSVESAKNCLGSIYKWFYPDNEWDREYDEDIPMNCIYMKW